MSEETKWEDMDERQPQRGRKSWLQKPKTLLDGRWDWHYKSDIPLLQTAPLFSYFPLTLFIFHPSTFIYSITFSSHAVPLSILRWRVFIQASVSSLCLLINQIPSYLVWSASNTKDIHGNICIITTVILNDRPGNLTGLTAGISFRAYKMLWCCNCFRSFSPKN